MALAAASSQLHDRLTMRPLFDFRYKIGVGTARTDDGFLRLENVGEGAGTIKSVEACFDGQFFVPTASALKAALGSGSDVQPFTLKKNQKIGKGGQARILAIPAGVTAATFGPDQARKKAVARLKIHVLYASSYDDEDVVDLDVDLAEGLSFGKTRAEQLNRSPGDTRCQDWIDALSACSRKKASDGRITVDCPKAPR